MDRGRWNTNLKKWKKCFWLEGQIASAEDIHAPHSHTRAHTKLFLITGSQARTKCKAACPLGLTGRWLLLCWMDIETDKYTQTHAHRYTKSLCVTWTTGPASAQGISFCRVTQKHSVECVYACVRVCVRSDRRGDCFWLAHCSLWENSWQLPELTLFCTKGKRSVCVCV